MPRGYATHPKTIACVVCGVGFTQRHPSQKFCNTRCKRKTYQQAGGCESTERQYEHINGNWDRYFSRLVTFSRRKALSVEMLLKLLDSQKGKCALTGVELTCVLVKGVTNPTNASIDRIDNTRGYEPDNIHLVCAVVNKFRVDTPLSEFIEWCVKVANYAIQESKKR